jgi:hypothetical protein
MRIVILKDCGEIRYYRTYFFLRIDHSHLPSFYTIVCMYVRLTLSMSQIVLDSTHLLRSQYLSETAAEEGEGYCFVRQRMEWFISSVV